MLLILLFISLRIFIPFFVILVGFILSYNNIIDREKSSPFECGFDPKNSARIPFSSRFFLLAVIFLVFDIEIALIMPLPLMFLNNMTFEALLGGLRFLVILIAGLLHE